MREATAYHRDGKYFVHAIALTTEGISVYSEPVFAIPDTAEPKELGEAILAALNCELVVVPQPRTRAEWKSPMTRLLSLAGVKTFSAFCKSAKCVFVEEENGRVTIAPTQNADARGTFLGVSGHEVHTRQKDPARLGAIVQEVFRAST